MVHGVAVLLLAPLGTAARPDDPSLSSTSTSTVGFPRLSRICRPWTFMIVLIDWFLYARILVDYLYELAVVDFAKNPA